MKMIGFCMAGLVVAGGLAGCNKVSEFHLRMEEASFRQECFGNPSYDCVNRRVNFNEKLIDIARKHWEEAKGQALPQIGEQRFRIVGKVFNDEYARQERDRPSLFMRWFFGDHIVPYQTANLLFNDEDLERILANAKHIAETTPGLEPLPNHQPANNRASKPNGNQLTEALETPVDLEPAASATVAGPTSQKTAPTLLAASTVAISPTLARLFVPDAIEGNVAWLESMTGPARQVQDKGNGIQWRVYRIDGCKVTVLANRQTIDELSLDLGPTCNVPLRPMVANAPDLSVNGLTFGDLFENGADDIQLQCAGPSECGNSADPTMQATLGGSHADNFLEVVFNGEIVGDQNVDALLDVMQAESARTGNTNLELDAKNYNSDPKFSDLVQQKMGGVKITSLTFKSSM